MNEPDRGNIDELVMDQCKQFIECIKNKDIVTGKEIIRALQVILDSTIDEFQQIEDITLEFETPTIRYDGTLFCLTGGFEYGSREGVTKSITERGGIIVNTVSSKLNYLIVGSSGSEHWIHQKYGRKIQKALELKEQSQYQESIFCPAIIHESHWVKSL